MRQPHTTHRPLRFTAVMLKLRRPQFSLANLMSAIVLACVCLAAWVNEPPKGYGDWVYLSLLSLRYIPYPVAIAVPLGRPGLGAALGIIVYVAYRDRPDGRQ